MKKTLLLLIAISSNCVFSQTLESDNFNGLTIGNIGTDITGTTPGVSNWLTFSSNGTAPTTSTNANNTNYQVVANGNSSTNGLQITSPNGDKGNRFMWKNGLATSWGARTSGNNIIEVQYDFYTGPITNSRTQIGMRIFGLDGTNTSRTLNGFVYTTNTRVLSGVAYLNNGGTPGTFLITLATGGLVLNSDTWYSIGCSYNTITGEILWKTSPASPSSGVVNTAWIPNLSPNEIDFIQAVVAASPTANPPVPANNVTSSIIFDNYVARASNADTLLSNENFSNNSLFNVNLFPNPVIDYVSLNIIETQVKKITISDINGRIVKNATENEIVNLNINLSDLDTGIYILMIDTDKGISTQKIIKK